jgi:hypothetical protein
MSTDTKSKNIELEKIINSYKIEIYNQKIIINQLKNKLLDEEMAKKYYIKKYNLLSKL